MDFVATLSGGDRRTLKGVDAALDAVRDDPALLPQLFACILSDDEIVRMRAADACEKLCRECPEWFVPYTERLLTDVAAIDQASVQWHLAQMLAEIHLSAAQRRRAVAVLLRQLDRSDDWIVVNLTLEALAGFVPAELDTAAFRDLLDRYAGDSRRSVRARVRKLAKALP